MLRFPCFLNFTRMGGHARIEGMKVQLNGDWLELKSPCSVAELLDRQNLTERRVAVEINGDIIPRSEHANHSINDGDRIEIVHALAGG